MRKIETDLSEFLEGIVISNTQSSAHGDDPWATAQRTGYVSDEEIEEFCQRYLTFEYRKQGYGHEDYEESKEVLTLWRNEYFPEGKPNE